MVPTIQLSVLQRILQQNRGKADPNISSDCGEWSRDDTLVQGGLIQYYKEAMKGREIELLIYFMFGCSRLGAAPGQLSLGGCSSWENLRIQKDASKVVGRFFPKTVGAFQGLASVSHQNKHNVCQ